MIQVVALRCGKFGCRLGS